MPAKYETIAGMPARALYYPYSTIRDPAFLVDALLYWDRLGCIRGSSQVPAGALPDDEMGREMRELHDQFVDPIVPDAARQDQLHDRLMTLLRDEPPAWYRPLGLPEENLLWLDSRKLLDDTAQKLRERGWVSSDFSSERLHVSAAAGTLILAQLTELLASPTMPPITDNRPLYQQTCDALLMELGAAHGLGGGESDNLDEVSNSKSEAASGDDEQKAAWVTLTIERLACRRKDVTPRMLRRVRTLLDYAEMHARRRAFREQVDEYVESLREATSQERDGLMRHYHQELRRDRDALKRELRRVLPELVFDPGIGAVGTLAGVAGVPIALEEPLGLIALIPTAGGMLSHARKRRRKEILDSHWSSWLFELNV